MHLSYIVSRYLKLCVFLLIIEFLNFHTAAPTITTITPTQVAEVGQEVKMKCEAVGSPEPKIRWRHTRPNTRLPNGIEGQYKKGMNLDIDSIKLEDRGEYECIANNGIPNEKFKPSKTTYIQMECKLYSRKLKSGIDTLFDHCVIAIGMAEIWAPQ